MNEKEYLNKATSKIVISSEKTKVYNELSDHIELKKASFKEMGYDEEAAEAKAAEAMGNADEIADTLGTIHNNFYNPAPDIILSILWFLLLGAGYFVCKKFLFGDPGTISILLATCAFSLVIFFLSAAITARKKSVYKPFYLFAGGIATSVYNYMILSEINKITYGNKEYLLSYFKNSNINFKSVKPDEKFLYLIIAVLSIIMFLFFLATLVYGIKKLRFANTRTDNKINRITINVAVFLCVISIIVTAGFCVKFFIDRKAYYNDYFQSLSLLQDISENCHGNQEVLDYLDENKIEYQISKSGVCSIPRIFSVIKIEFQDHSSGDYPNAFNLEDEFNYKITVTLPTDTVENQLDSLTLSEFKTNEKTIDEITSYLPYEYTGREDLEFYSSYVPTFCTYKYLNNELYVGQFEYRYTTGSSYHKNYSYTFNIEKDEFLNFKKDADQIAEKVKKNIDKSHKEIAQITNTTLINPPGTKDQWDGYINTFGTILDPYKPALKVKYEQLYEYKISDKWAFSFHVNADGKRDRLDFYYKDISLSLWNINLTNEPNISFGEGSNMHSKIAYNSGYFDKYGRYYTSALMVRYYTKEGKSFSYYSLTNQKAENEEDFKKYYLVDEKGNKYLYDDCFIDEDGWLCFNKTGNLKMVEENVYENSSGKIFTKPFATNWDNNGNLITVEKQKEIIGLLESEALL